MISCADSDAIERWYVERFQLLQRTAFQDPRSYFHHYRDLEAGEVDRMARDIWRRINLPNLHENILPSRDRARLVVRKGLDHAVEEIRLRRI